MATRYRIFAHSKTHNQLQQQMDLTNDSQLTDAVYAQQAADAFAKNLNTNFFLHVCDWTSSIEAYEHVDNPQPFQLPKNSY